MADRFPPAVSSAALSVQREDALTVHHALPEETPVAMVFDATTLAVMMASPADIEDFATGFTLTEGVVDDAAEIEEIRVVAHPAGLEAQMWLAGDRGERLARRRRSMVGPVGCGLCGIESLEAAIRALPQVGGAGLPASQIAEATDALRRMQPLHDATRAVHAAGFVLPGRGVVLAREDVGRHNALDKLIGAMARGGIDASRGAVVLTSRVSLEMVQKTVMAGAGLLIAVSAPTAHAVRLADTAGLTVAALARGGGFETFTHPRRVLPG